MARGDSGRIVLEIDPALKLDLYTAVTRDGLTLKAWFMAVAARYLDGRKGRPLLQAGRAMRRRTPQRSASRGRLGLRVSD